MKDSRRRYSLGDTYKAAMHEASLRGDRKISTEHIVLALLADPASKAAKVMGCDLQTARDALDELDHHALLAVGVDAERRSAPPRSSRRGRFPVTPAVVKLLQGSVEAAGHRRDLAPEHILMALIERQPLDPATALLASLGLDAATIRERLNAA